MQYRWHPEVFTLSTNQDNTVIDLDEALLRVRSPEAKADACEAIACYNGGAYRAAIVMTWAAVAYDIMAKVRELELTGDKKAKRAVADFEKIQSSKDLKASQEWERTILDVARDEFELLTHQEHADLERLRLDRHRCAHPAMNTADEAYRPPAELVRYHLGSAFSHLLTRAPVQGQAALSRLCTEVQSSYFPADAVRAAEAFMAGPLQRPKSSLVRNFVMATVKASLTGDQRKDVTFQRRLRAALGAVSTMHPVDTKMVLAEKLPGIARSLNDEDLPRLIVLAIFSEPFWTSIPADVLTKLQGFVKSASLKQFGRVILIGAERAELRQQVQARIAEATREDLTTLARSWPTEAGGERAVLDRAVSLLEGAKSFDWANAVATSVLRPLVTAVDAALLTRIATAAVKNTEVRGAFDVPPLIAAIRAARTIDPETFRRIADETGLTNEFPGLVGAEVDDGKEEEIGAEPDDLPF